MTKEAPVGKSRYVAALLVALSLTSPLTAQQAVLTVEQVDRWMTDLSNWGRWGKDDQRGTLNLMTPAVAKEAAKLVKDGVSVSLAHTMPVLGGTGFPLNPIATF